MPPKGVPGTSRFKAFGLSPTVYQHFNTGLTIAVPMNSRSAIASVCRVWDKRPDMDSVWLAVAAGVWFTTAYPDDSWP